MQAPLPRHCPVCSAGREAAELYMHENIDQRRLSGFSFASRKEPEYMCHQLVRCKTCDLVYADQPPDERELLQAYHSADYDSSEEADDAALAYRSALSPILSRLAGRSSALEIGTGNGAFLEQLLAAGFRQVVGIEPSAAAIAAAPEHRRAWIREGLFRREDFASGSFDLICCFMTMEHVRDPGLIARAAFDLLSPGGVFVTVTHNYRGFVNRLLAKRSPIIDIEHLQLFSPDSIRYLFTANGYQDVTAHAFANRYSMAYWLRLAPLPAALKRFVNSVFSALRLDKLKLRVNVGNTLAAGFKPSR